MMTGTSLGSGCPGVLGAPDLPAALQAPGLGVPLLLEPSSPGSPCLIPSPLGGSLL